MRCSNWFRIGIAGLALLAASHAWAAEKDGDGEAPAENPVRVVSGVGFSVPADWPIERRNGATGPIPIEEYMSMKFKRLEDRVRVLEEKLEEKQGDREKNTKPEKNRLESYEASTQTQGE